MSVKVEVGQYREVNKGALKAFFSLVIYPEGLKIMDCKYFVQGSSSWFSFPQKEVKFTDGRKSEYAPLIHCLNKEYSEQLKIAVLKALKEQGKNEQVSSSSRKKDLVRDQAQDDAEELPF